jgi:uncharacterized protein (DUF2384 family)
MKGALARKLGTLRSRGAFDDADVAKALGAETSTVSGWEDGRLFPQVETEKTLIEFEYIVELLADFYQPDEARRWFSTPQKLLNGAIPIDLIRQGKIDEVLRLAGQLREAEYF